MLNCKGLEKKNALQSGIKKDLGIGIGLRPAHFAAIFASLPSIDWFEIISENYMGLSGRPLQNLERILERYPVVMHGVSLSIGGPDPLNFDYLKKLKELAKKTKSPWVSDHLCWGRAKGAYYHDLLPLPYTPEVCDYVIERARIVQDFLEVPFALENISSYAQYQVDAMKEWDFYREVVERADISMLLDVNNIYVSSRNHGFNVDEYIQSVPFERVVQIHLAGHRNYGSYCLDTHDEKVCDAVWDLYAQVYAKIGPVATLLEWDDRFLSFEETWQEALKAKAFQNTLVHR